METSGSRERDTNYNVKLKCKLAETFEHYIDPSNVLRVFHRYDENVLTTVDIQTVEAKRSNEGPGTAARLLLDKVICYDKWFLCLMNVLHDKNVKLHHVAKTMQEIKDSFDLEYTMFIGQDSNAEDSSRFSANQDVLGGACPQSDFTLPTDDEIEDDRPTPMDIPSPSSPTDTTGKEEQPSGSSATHSERGSASVAAAAERISDDDVVNQIGTDETDGYDNVRFRHNPQGQQGEQKEKQRVIFNVQPGDGETSGADYRREMKQKKRERGKPSSHGTEYDFDPEDVKREIGHLPGWIPDITETEIWQLLTPVIDQDGSYILWYWPKKKRPAICVTDNGEVKTVIVHKKPAKPHRSRKEFYFINKREMQAETLLEIVEHHLEHGMKDMTPGREQETISFKLPVSTE